MAARWHWRRDGGGLAASVIAPRLRLSSFFRTEETRRLWREFLDDFAGFEDWLEAAERTAANPDSADVLYVHAKEELKKFEVNFLSFGSPPRSLATLKEGTADSGSRHRALG